MTKTIFATKFGMTGKFTPEGEMVGVTMLKLLPMTVDGLRIQDKHGYKAVRYKIESGKRKPLFREVRSGEELEAGTGVNVNEVLKIGDIVQVSAISKGKGTAGVVKRYKFAGGPRTHGQSDRERAPGSSGSNTTPGRVLKGKRRAGHMGAVRMTLRGMKVLEIDGEKGMLTLIGSIPGNRSTLVTIKKL